MKKKSTAQLKSLGTIFIGASSLLAAMSSMAAAPVVAHTHTTPVVAHTHTTHTVHPAVEVTTNGNLLVKNMGHSRAWFKVGGLLQIDQTFFPTKNKSDASRNNLLPSGANLRRARLNFCGGQGPNWSYSIVLNSISNSFNVYNAFVNYKGLFPEFKANVAVGQISRPFGLEHYGSSNDMMFLEYAPASNMFGHPRNGVGIYADAVINDQLLVQAQVYQPDINLPARSDSSVVNTQKSERWGGTGRLVFSPIHTEEQTVHIGLSGTLQYYLTNQTADILSNVLPFKTRGSLPGFVGYDAGTSALPNLKFNQSGVFELANITGPLSLQGEFFMGKLKSVDGREIKPLGFYAQAGYILTGESRPYDVARGTIGRPTPTCETGAWEVALRYDLLDLNRNGITAGKQYSVTGGVNWFASKNIRISTNVMRTFIEPAYNDVKPHKKHINAVAMRFQAAW